MRLPGSIGLLVAGAMALAACGSDEGVGAPSPNDTLSTVPESSPATSSPAELPGGPGDRPAIDLPVEPTREYEVPTGPDDVVISYAETGGFTTARLTFQQPPRILVSGDGLSFEPAPQTAIFPGPLLPALQTRTISDLGIQRLLAAADAAGLLADVDYEIDSNVADASTAVVTINVDGETWVHEAYALGFGAGPGSDPDTTPERQALLDFTLLLSDLAALSGEDEVGEFELLEPESFEIVATQAPPGTSAPRLEVWQATDTIRLADAATCTVVSGPSVTAMLDDADEETFFLDEGLTYEVFARPGLPGSTCT